MADTKIPDPLVPRPGDDQPATVAQLLNAVTTILDGVEKKMAIQRAYMDTRFDRVDSRLESVETRVATVETRVATVETRVTAIHRDLLTLRSQLVGVVDPQFPALADR
ncbi:hypothetical protein [Candidatus Palauibacter sp.]|uniref:hypothetical protein n=1 Tax=Candidatus Palauibacter sp. TaxID=3101350 RepID=UPI003B5C6681